LDPVDQPSFADDFLESQALPDEELDAAPGVDRQGPPYSPDGPDPRAGTAYWRVSRLGRRPEDFAARDFLTGSLLRDFRPQGYRRASREPSIELSNLVPNTVPDVHGQAALNLLLLDYAQRQSLTKLVASYRVEGRLADLVPALWRCPPFGALVTGQGGQPPSPQLVCKHSWLCPWCRGRLAVDLYRRLSARLTDRLSGKYLLLAIAQFSRPAAGFRDDAALTSQECRSVRRRATAALRARVKAFGVTDGLVTYAVGPFQVQTPGRSPTLSFVHRVAVLGELELAGSESIAINGVGLHTDAGRTAIGKCGTYPARLRYLRYHVPKGDRRALRRLLLGSAAGFRPDDLPLLDTREPEEDGYEYGGILGALALQPCFMFSPEQWVAYEASTSGIKSYSLFGKWYSPERG
jgi:hypothetical protein